MKLTWRMTIILMVVLGTLSATTVIVIGLPPDGDVPANGDGTISWHSLRYDNGISIWETIDLGITEEDYLRAAEDTRMRHGTLFAAVPLALADPDDPYVLKIADRIDELTEGCDELTRATVAAHFVQTGISYISDKDLYGVSDRWASPVETLYLGRGDCEDSAVLLLSIYMAMSLECALLDYEHHIDTAVRIDGEWRLCYASSYGSHRLVTDLTMDGEYPEIYRPGDYSELSIWVNDGLAKYRQGIKDTIGI